MDPNKLQASFIPKRPLADSPRLQTRSTMSIFLLGSIAVFIIMLALSAGIYFLNRHETDLIAQKNAQLSKDEKDLSGDLIANLQRLDTRINAARTVLQKHVSLSTIFKLLEDTTTINIRYSNLKYNVSVAGLPTLMLSGQGKTFNSISYQSDVFRSTAPFKNPLFSDVRLDDHGNVLFDVTTGLDPALILYSNSLGISKTTNS